MKQEKYVFVISGTRINTKNIFGPKTRTFKLCAIIHELGYNVIMFCPMGLRDKPVENYSKNLSIIRIPPLAFPRKYIPVWGDFLAYPLPLFLFLLGFIKTRKVRLIIGLNPPDAPIFVGLLVAKLFKIPLIYDFQDLWLNLCYTHGAFKWKRNGIRAKIQKFIEDFILGGSSLILTPWWGIKHKLTKRGVPKDKITIAWWAKEVSQESSSEGQYRLRGNPIIAFGGSITFMKDRFLGLKNLIKSIKLLRKNIPDIRLYIFGDGAALQYFKQYVQKLELENHVILFGYVSRWDLENYLKETDILIDPSLPTEYRKFVGPMKIFEYLALKKPIICVNSFDLDKILLNPPAAYLIKDIKPSTIANAIEYLYKNESFSEHISNNAFNLSSSKYSWIRLEKILKDVLLKYLV